MIAIKNDKRGFTLIEMMMVVAILGVVLSVFYNYLGFNFKFLNERNTENESYLQAKIAMQRTTTHLLGYQKLEIINTAGENYYVKGKGYPREDGTEESEALFNNNITDNSNAVVYYLEILDPTTGIGRLKKSGNVIANNVKVNIAKDTNNKYLQITVESFPDAASNLNCVKLSTIIRLDRKRSDL